MLTSGDATFTNLVRGCPAPVSPGSCGDGGTCVEVVQSPFSALCVARAGDDHACNDSAYPVERIYFDGFIDTRGCEDCTCGAPSGSTCAAHVDLWEEGLDAGCATFVTSVTSGGCTNISGNPPIGGRILDVNVPIFGGSCAPDGGQPFGEVITTGPTTFCCTN